MNKTKSIFAVTLFLCAMQGFAEESKEDTKPKKSEVNLEPSEEFWEQMRLIDLVQDSGGSGGGGGSGSGDGSGDGQFNIPPLKTRGPTGGKCLSGYCAGWRFGF